MQFINRDPEKSPEVPSGMLDKAREQGYFVFALTIDNGGDDIAHFFVMAPFRLNVGDEIKTKDGVLCKVAGVQFVTAMSDVGVRLVASVFAEGPDCHRAVLP